MLIVKDQTGEQKMMDQAESLQQIRDRFLSAVKSVFLIMIQVYSLTKEQFSLIGVDQLIQIIIPCLSVFLVITL